MADFIASPDFEIIRRILNTNVNGLQKTQFALTAISGVGRRLSNMLCKKADIDLTKRAGELTLAEIEEIQNVLKNPRHYKIPDWFLNRRKDIVTGKTSQIFSNQLIAKLRDDLEGLKRIRAHRGLRHYWGLKVRGQHTKTTGRGIRQNALAPKGKR